jgi:peptidoglycan/LPS O-acetylase OafA/YrhL
MQNAIAPQQAAGSAREQVRLYYLDWLRVLSALGVFLFHAACVFNAFDFHIKNSEQSTAITLFHCLLFPWGMPLFFLIAGAGSWFALQRRTAGEYARERCNRLLIPFVAGCLLLTPIQLLFEWSHKAQTGVIDGSFLDLVRALPWGPNPRIFGVVGYHLWFLGFLLCYSLLALPLFGWLKKERGQAFVAGLARLCERRGGILLLGLPPMLVRLGLHPFFPQQHNWADFFVLMSFFISGYVLYADRRFVQAIGRDWRIMLVVGSTAFLAGIAFVLVTGGLDIEAAPRTIADFAWWSLISVCGWCWTAVMVFIGARFLDFASKWLRFGQEAVLPFYVVHQPVIIVTAYFVVQWDAGLVAKLLAVVVSAFPISLGLARLTVRRGRPLRAAPGATGGRAGAAQAAEG